jgi:hypothetical protein
VAEITRRSLLGKTFTILPASSLGLSAGAAGAAEDTGDARSTPAAPVAQGVWTPVGKHRRIWGYADRHSVDTGDGFSLVLSTGPGIPDATGKINVSRIGNFPHSDRQLFWQSETLTVNQRPAQVTSSCIGTDWPFTVEGISTKGWPSGYYTVDFVLSANDIEPNIAYIVVTNPDRSGEILLLLSTNTYNAYNDWGGYSFYRSLFLGDRAQMLSFDRPSSTAFFVYEYYLARWIEQIASDNQINVDYATNFDLHRDARFVENYPLLISGSHNEYWSKEEFEGIHRRIFKLGKSTFFLGANTAYWQVRYADIHRTDADFGRQLICFKSPRDPISAREPRQDTALMVTDRFRDAVHLPENMLVGVAFQSYFDEDDSRLRYSYFVKRTDFPFFAGTGYKVGDDIGKIVGYEWDNIDPKGDGKRLWNASTSRIPIIPESKLKVLFEGTPLDLDGRPGKAQAVYFKSDAGAEVFAAGSIRWAWGLGKPGYDSEPFRIFNLNLVLQALRRR